MHRKLSQFLQRLSGIDCSCRIIGSVDQDSSCLICNSVSDRFRIKAEIFSAGHKNRSSSGHLYHFSIADPARVWNDDLLAGITDRHQSSINALLCPCSNGNLIRSITDMIFPFQFPADCLPKRQDTHYRRVFREPLFQRLICRCTDMGRSDKIRLPHIQADHFFPLPFQLCNACCQLHCFGRFDMLYPFCCHFFLSLLYLKTDNKLCLLEYADASHHRQRIFRSFTCTHDPCNRKDKKGQRKHAAHKRKSP